ncbi:MAG: GmrSD restriction endonuclease domain-containing protein [Mycobacteriales bacterium]
MTGYARSEFGPAWADVDQDGCDTRNDVLTRDLTATTYRSSCVVGTGILLDPYTGRTIPFVRGERTSSAVQIDHVVSLGDAWQTGAATWSASKREAFANDRIELLAVDGPTNDAKGDGDAATWLPPNKGYRCAYVARQVAVKARYGLWMTSAEAAASARVLARCPEQALPRASAPIATPIVAPTYTPPPPTYSPPPPVYPPPTTTAPLPPPTTAPGLPPAQLDPRFGTCKEANANGYGPYYQGQDPEYGWYADRDGDGVDCES